MESAGFLPVLLLPHRTAPHIFQSFHRRARKVKGWRALPSKIVSSRSRTGSSWCCSPRSGRARSPRARRCRSTATTTRTRSSRCARSPTRRSGSIICRMSVVRGMQKHVEMDEPEEAPELEHARLFGVADPAGAVIGENETRRGSGRGGARGGPARGSRTRTDLPEEAPPPTMRRGRRGSPRICSKSRTRSTRRYAERTADDSAEPTRRLPGPIDAPADSAGAPAATRGSRTGTAAP